MDAVSLEQRRQSFDPATAYGLLNAANLLTSGAWLLVAKLAHQRDTFFALLLSTNLAVVAPLYYISSVDSVPPAWFPIVLAEVAFLYNACFVVIGLMLSGQEATTLSVKLASAALLYGFMVLFFVIGPPAQDPDDGSRSITADFWIWAEPGVNAVCLLWFVTAAVYRYCLCVSNEVHNFFPYGRWKTFGIQLLLMASVLAEKFLVTDINNVGLLLRWKLAHWVRTLIMQGTMYVLVRKSTVATVQFRP